MGEKLTDLQRAILSRAITSHPDASTWWLSGQIETKVTFRGCRQLHSKGFLRRGKSGRVATWTITDAGRSALSTLQQEGSEGG